MAVKEAASEEIVRCKECGQRIDARSESDVCLDCRFNGTLVGERTADGGSNGARSGDGGRSSNGSESRKRPENLRRQFSGSVS